VSNEYGFIGLHNIALHLETDAWVDVVHDPHRVEGIVDLRYAGELSLGDWRADSWAVLVTRERHNFTIQMFVGNNSNFLPVSNEFIATEDVLLLHSLQLEYGSSHWPCVLALSSARHLEASLNIRNFIPDVHN